MRKETYLRLSGNFDQINEPPHPLSKMALDRLEKIAMEPNKGLAWYNLYEYAAATRKRHQNFIQYIFDVDPF